MNKRTYFTWALSLLLLHQSCKDKGAGAPQGGGALPYPVTEVAQRDVTAYREFPVTIEGMVNSDVRAKIQGYIKEVYVDEGESVKKGQRLFRLETNTLDKSADASKAAVEAAKVEVDKLEPLVEKGIISPVQLQTAKANLLQAEANYNSVRANIGYSIITAPIDGIVGSLPLRIGSLVGPADQVPLTTVSDTDQLYAYFSMGESDYLDFLQNTPGETLTEKLANFPEVGLIMANGAEYADKGKISAVTGQVDPRTGTVRFRAVFDNGKRLLTNGNSGTLRLPHTYENVLVVPEAATFEQQGVSYVYKVEQDTALSHVIKVQGKANNLTIVEEGLSKGDMIVAKGIGNLRTGTPIVPQPVSLDSIVSSVKPVFK